MSRPSKPARSSLLAAALFVVAAGASGCSCGSDKGVGGPMPGLCVRPSDGSANCSPDATDMDWGTVMSGDTATINATVINDGTGQALLTISSVDVSSETVGGSAFEVVLCDGTCDDEANVVSLPVQLAQADSLSLRVTFDATDLDGLFPAESLIIVSNAGDDTTDPIGLYVRPFVGVLEGCRDGAFDANGDPEDGCECLPSEDGTEHCDGFDNDCDGVVDEDVAGTSIVCTTGQPGECATGTTQCTGGAFQCVPDVGVSAEVCDTLDNDCDGLVDEENTWAPFSEGLSGGNMADVAFDPRWADRAYASVGNQVYRSDDGGLTFQAVGFASQGVQDFAFPSNVDSVVLAASGSGVIRSEDDGVTWSTTALDGLGLTTILVHPADPNHVYVGTLGGGIFKSTNGGMSFVPASGGLSADNWFESFTGDPNDPDIVVAGLTKLNTPQPPVGEIVRTVNGGATWTVVKTGGRATRVTTCETDPGHLVASVVADGLYESMDGGASWTLAGLANKQVVEVALPATDCSTVYAGETIDGIYRSDDAAQSFQGPFNTGFDVQRPGDLTTSVDPANPARVLASNHSGVFLTENSGATWVRVPQISGAVARRLVTSPADPERLWLATWGQGVWTRPLASDPWQKIDANVLPKDWAMSVAPDPIDMSRVLVGGWGTLYRSADAASSFTAASGPANVFSVAYHPQEAQMIFAGDQLFGVWKSTDGGQAWSPAVAGLPAAWETGNCVCQDVRVVTIDSTTNRLLAGSNLRGIFVSDDDAASWQPSEPALADESISCIRERQGELYACVREHGLWKSSDGGDTFAPITQGQTDVTNIADMLVDETTGDMFAVSDQGVFRSSDGTSWEDMDNSCLPAKPNTAPAIVESNGQRLLVVATSGAGAFVLPLE